MNKNTKVARLAILFSSLTLLILMTLMFAGPERPVSRGAAAEGAAPSAGGADTHSMVASDMPPGPRGTGEPDSGAARYRLLFD